MTESAEKTTITGYHTSRPCGGWVYIFKNGPFYSKQMPQDSHPKWLGDGYYFWTDSTHFAHEWGRNRTFKTTGYTIVEHRICLKKAELLDLVGDVDHQLMFQKAAYKMLAKKSDKALTVLNTINFLRGKFQEKFPWLAIKAQDDRPIGQVIPFKDYKGSEAIRLPTRQQVCVYKEGKHLIKNIRIVFPTDYAESCQEYIDAIERV